MYRLSEFSDDGLYRYRQYRIWDDKKPQLPVICLNPKTASGDKDSSTDLLIKIAKDNYFGSILAVNLFALVTPHIYYLRGGPDPIGPKNNRVLAGVFDEYPVALMAWGAGKINTLLSWRVPHIKVLWETGLANTSLFCLGTSTRGHPLHPMASNSSSSLEPFSFR